MNNERWCKKHKTFLWDCGCPDPRAFQSINAKDKKSCSKFHELNQDKDDLCPYCGNPINDDF